MMGIITKALGLCRRRAGAPKLCSRCQEPFHSILRSSSRVSPWLVSASSLPPIAGGRFCAFSTATAQVGGREIPSSQPLFGPHLFVPSKFDIIIGDDDDESHEIGARNVAGLESDVPKGGNYFQMLNVGENKVVKTRMLLGNSWERNLLYPEEDAICIGASHGWLAFLNPVGGGSLFLLNPFTSQNTKFPPFRSLPSVETLPFVQALRTGSCSSEFIGLRRNPKTCIQKLVLSSTPSSVPTNPFNNKQNQNDGDDCIAVVIGGDKSELACCRLGETSWFGFGGGRDSSSEYDLGPYSDVTYSSKDGLFYALRGGSRYRFKDGRFYPLRGPDRDVQKEVGTVREAEEVESQISVEAWDLSSLPFSPKKKMNAVGLPVFSRPFPFTELKWDLCQSRRYLVESSLTGNLLLVERLVDNYVHEDTRKSYCPKFAVRREKDEDTRGRVRERHTYATRRIDVFMTTKNEVHQMLVWEHVKCLGDQALIVGLNHSMSLSTIDYPMLKKNSIYFCDDDIDEMAKSDKFGGHDFGIYDLEKGKVASSICTDVKKFNQPPIWILPHQV